MNVRYVVLLLFALFEMFSPSHAYACSSEPSTHTQAQARASCEAFRIFWANATWGDPLDLMTCVERGDQYQIWDGNQYEWVGNFPYDTTCPIAQANYPQKNLGEGSGCNCGEGTPGGSGSSAGGSAIASGRQDSLLVGDPINASTGNSYLQDEDYGEGWLTLRRFYNSSSSVISTYMGTRWRHSFDRSLWLFGSPIASAVVFRPDGLQEVFTKVNGQWRSDPDVVDTLTETVDAQGAVSGYTLSVASLHQLEAYDTNGLLRNVTDENGVGITLAYSTSQTPGAVAPISGLLLTVTDPKGRQLNFTYYTNGYLHQVALPDGGMLTYTYDSTGNLVSVQYPDGKTRQYVYNESSLTGGVSLPNAMTGIVDEGGVRYESTGFDGSGRATSSSFAGGVGATSITYNSDGTSLLQYPLGVRTTMVFSTAVGVNKVASLDQACGTDCGQRWKTRTYDANGNPATYIDFNGNVTKTVYDANNLLNQQIDAPGTSSQRTANLTWNTSLRVPLSRTVLDANGNTVSSTKWVYNSAGQTLSRCEIDPSNSAAAGYTCSATDTVPAGVRRWTYTYCTAVDTTQCPIVGLMLTATGPRTDIPQTTTYSYYLASSATNCGTPGAACYQAGDLHTITDPQGHVTTIASYDGAGRITRITDANGINTDLTYTPRGWLASRSVGGALTAFTYMPYGTVQTVTDPDGVVTTYGYDAAHRLVKVTDAQGNSVQYTLDAAGNKTAEQVYDATGTLHKNLSRTFNSLGQLTKVMDGLNHTIFDASASNSYDANGNLVQSADGLGIQRQQGYDALNRLVQTLDNYNGTN